MREGGRRVKEGRKARKESDRRVKEGLRKAQGRVRKGEDLQKDE